MEWKQKNTTQVVRFKKSSLIEATKDIQVRYKFMDVILKIFLICIFVVELN